MPCQPCFFLGQKLVGPVRAQKKRPINGVRNWRSSRDAASYCRAWLLAQTRHHHRREVGGHSQYLPTWVLAVLDAARNEKHAPTPFNWRAVSENRIRVFLPNDGKPWQGECVPSASTILRCGPTNYCTNTGLTTLNKQFARLPAQCDNKAANHVSLNRRFRISRMS